MIPESKSKIFLIGAQKAGTTSLFDWISQHPEVNAPSEVKDFHFFSNDELYAKGIDFYESFFEKQKQDFNVVFSAAVNYLYHSNSAKRIYDYDKNSKFLIVLRNPVDRAISAYHYFKKIGVENLSLENAIEEESDRCIDYYTKSNFSYSDHGKYYEQINRFLEYFPIENFKFILFEDLINEKDKTIESIFEFMKIDKTFLPNYKQLNKKGEPVFMFVNKLLFKKTKFRSLLMSIFGKLIPVRIRTNIKNKLVELNRSKSKKVNEDNLSINLKMKIYNKVKDDINLLENFLGLKLDSWRI